MLSPRSETEILAELELICRQPGFVYVIATLCVRDNFVGYLGELKPDDYAKLFSWSRLIRTEMSTLIGLMAKGDIDLSPIKNNEIESLMQRCDGLLRELHDRMNADFLPDFEAAMRGEVDDPFTSAKAMREPIFYSGESAYTFQYRDLAPAKYAEDQLWLKENMGFDASDARHIVKAIHDTCQARIDKFVSGPERLDFCLTQYLDLFCFTVDEVLSHAPDQRDKIEPFLKVFTILPGANEGFKELSDFNETNARPVIRKDNRLICLQYYALVEASYDAPFYWLVRDRRYEVTAARNRGAFVEGFCEQRLKSVFKAENVFRGAKVVKGSRELCEIDVLVTFADRLLLVQAKSKRLTIASRKGNDLQLKKDFKEAIQNAADQNTLCCNSILSEGSRVIDRDGQQIQVGKIKEIFPICLISENYPALSFQCRNFLRFESTQTVKEVLVIDVFAMDAICEMLDTPLRLLSYLQLRAEMGLKLSMAHENTALSFHLRRNLWVQGYDMILLEDDIAASLDVAMAVRRDGVSGNRTPEGILTELRGTTIGRIVEDIEKSESHSYIEFGLMLMRISLKSARAIGEYIDLISKITDPLAKRDVTVWTKEDSSGVTIHCNNLPYDEAHDAIFRYCTLRKYAQRARKWFGLIVEPVSGALKQGITVDFAWVHSSEWDMATSGMVDPSPMRNVWRQLRRKRKIGRNEKCSCGSGLKYKRCCARDR